MKIQLLFLVIFKLTISSTAYAQEEIKPIKRISLQDISIQTGLFSESASIGGTLTDFKSLSPQSILLNTMSSNFDSVSSFGYASLSAGPMFSALLEFQLCNNERNGYKSNVQLRFGVSFFTNTIFTGFLYDEVKVPYDTLVSSGTSDSIYMESIISESYRMDYMSKQLRFDGSLIFRTDQEKRMCLFVGVGMTVGISIGAYTNISRTDLYGVEVVSAYGSSTHYSAPTNKFETTQNKTNFGCASYIPMGVDFRLGKKKEKFLNRLHLFYELRPGINLTAIPELRIMTNVFVQQGFGMKVSL